MRLPNITLQSRQLYRHTKSNQEKSIISRILKEISLRDQRYDNAAKFRDAETTHNRKASRE